MNPKLVRRFEYVLQRSALRPELSTLERSTNQFLEKILINIIDIDGRKIESSSSWKGLLGSICGQKCHWLLSPTVNYNHRRRSSMNGNTITFPRQTSRRREKNIQRIDFQIIAEKFFLLSKIRFSMSHPNTVTTNDDELVYFVKRTRLDFETVSNRIETRFSTNLKRILTYT